MHLAVAIYAVAFSTYALLRYYGFATLYFDLGIFSSSMSQVVHGTAGLQTLILPSTPGHVGHFSPILVIPLALYAVLPSPATLLVFQSLLLALAAIPLFELAQEVLHRTDLAIGISLLYLLYPALQGVNRYDFHVEAFVPLLAFCALLAMVRGHYGGFLVASLLLLGTHEYLSIVYLWTGGVLVAYQLLTRQDVLLGLVSRRWTITATVLGGGFLALEEALNVLLTPSHASVFAWLGATTSGFSGGPSQLLAGLGVDLGWKLLYWALLLVPFLLLPLREARLLLPAVPWLGVTLLASNPAIYSIYSQYPALVLPFIFFAGIWALRRPIRVPHLPLPDRHLATALVVAGLVATATVGPLSPLNLYDGALSNHSVPPWPPVVSAHDQATARLLGLIPEDASVVAQSELFPQLSDHARVAPYWNVTTDGPPDYIALDTARTFFDNRVPPYPDTFEALARSIMSNDSYGLAGFSGTALVYRVGGFQVPMLSSADIMQPTASELASSWNVSGTAAVGPGGLTLHPSPGPLGLAWTPLAPHGDLLASAVLTWSNPTRLDAWSGIVFGTPDTLTYQAVLVYPGSFQIGYLRYVHGVPAVAALGTFNASGNSLRLDVVATGANLQVWADGWFTGFFAAEPSSNTTALGFATFGQDVTASGLVSYRSTADVPPAALEVPWDGIAAVVGLVVPVTAFLLAFPQPDVLVGRLLRRIRGR